MVSIYAISDRYLAALNDSNGIGKSPKAIAAKVLAMGAANTEVQTPQATAAYYLVGNIAIIPLVGVVTKYPAALGDETSLIQTQALLAAATADTNVVQIVLLIDSPGGTIDGVKELRDSIAACPKPVVAFGDDTICSAAYWLASACDAVFVNELCEVGSIGVYAVVEDFSAAYAQKGIKPYLLKAGEYKGSGQPGLPVDDKALVQIQKRVNQIYGVMTADIAAGRGITPEQLVPLAQGQTLTAMEALDADLVDGVGTLGETLTETTMITKKGMLKAETKTEVKAETSPETDKKTGTPQDIDKVVETQPGTPGTPDSNAPNPAEEKTVKADAGDASPLVTPQPLDPSVLEDKEKKEQGDLVTNDKMGCDNPEKMATGDKAPVAEKTMEQPKAETKVAPVVETPVDGAKEKASLLKQLEALRAEKTQLEASIVAGKADLAVKPVKATAKRWYAKD